MTITASPKMGAVVNFGPEPLSVEYRELDAPTAPADDEVILAVQAVGVCGSDLHQYHGTQSWRVNYPVALGHEFGGTVAAAGKSVRAFAEGDRVVSETAAVIDAASPYTRSGQYNLDPNRLGFGYGVSGAMTRYVQVPERCLHHIPDSLAFEKAALTEPCCVAYNAACVNTRIRPGDAVVVIGPGPIGLLCAMMAKLSGASPLIVVGTASDGKRLAAARAPQIGATHTLGEQGEDVKEFVRGMGDGYGVDVVIDAAGVSPTMALALDIVRPGGHVAKVGWGPAPYGHSLDPLVQKGVTLQGSYSHNWPMWERVIAMLASGQIDLTPIIGMVRPLREWKTAFDAMHSGEIVKAVLTP